jgi:hypothetical protein
MTAQDGDYDGCRFLASKGAYFFCLAPRPSQTLSEIHLQAPLVQLFSYGSSFSSWSSPSQ